MIRIFIRGVIEVSIKFLWQIAMSVSGWKETGLKKIGCWSHMTGSWQSHRQAMKNGQRSPKWRWKDASGRNLVAIAFCTALISMFSAVFVSILWETYNQPPKATNSTGNKTAYRYPVYKLNFKKVLKDRENLAEVYGYKLNSAQVERRSDLSLQEFFDLYDGKW